MRLPNSGFLPDGENLAAALKARGGGGGTYPGIAAPGDQLPATAFSA